MIDDQPLWLFAIPLLILVAVVTGLAWIARRITR